MKIIMDQNDINYIERINNTGEEIPLLLNNKNIPLLLNNKNKKYYLEFECDDIGKANAFIGYLMWDKHTENTGINVKALNYSLITRSAVLDILEESINKINAL